MFVYIEYELLGINLVLLPYLLLFLFSVSELSDAFDGFFARRLNQVTDLGKILDPMADSIYRISVFLTFTRPPVNLPLLLVFIFIYRDSVISTLRTICALRGFALAARATGKMKAVLQAGSGFVILLLFLAFTCRLISNDTLTWGAIWVTSISALYALYSAVDYIFANREYVVRLLTKEGEAP